MSCFPSFTRESSLWLLIYWIIKFTQHFGRKTWILYTKVLIISMHSFVYFLSQENASAEKKDILNTWIHLRRVTLAETICNNWRIYHDTNLIKRAVGIHFTRLIYVWITTLFSAEISRRSELATYLSLFITTTIIADIDILNLLMLFLQTRALMKKDNSCV